MRTFDFDSFTENLVSTSDRKKIFLAFLNIIKI